MDISTNPFAVLTLIAFISGTIGTLSMVIAHRANRRSVASVQLMAFVLLWAMQARMAVAQDFQNRNEADLTASWKKVDFLVPLIARTDPNKPNPPFAATGVLALITLAKHIQLVGAYLFADLPQNSQGAHLQRNASGGAAPAHVLGTILTVRLTQSSLLRPTTQN